MAPRRASTRGGTSAPLSRRGTRGGIRKNPRTRQAPTRYDLHPEPAPSTPRSAETNESGSSSMEPEPSIPEYSHSPQSNEIQPSLAPVSPENPRPPPATPTTESEPESRSPSSPRSDRTISLGTMRQLLRSHEEDIIDRVVQRLRSHNPVPHIDNTGNTNDPIRATQDLELNPTLTRIAELEGEPAQLREEAQRGQQSTRNARALGMYNSSQCHLPLAGENASAIADSVAVLFPGVERGTLVQIIENRFKPTNIYRLLASEKERAESQRTVNIGGIEVEQAERDGKESEYRISIFFKAWAAYSGILVKLAPHSLQGDLATALSIYTMNLYDLLEKYEWEGVKAYHFQFHRKRVASGQSIYHGTECRQLDSELIASKCFAHPAPRPTWTQNHKLAPAPTRRFSELPIRESLPGHGYSSTPFSPHTTAPYSAPEYRTHYGHSVASPANARIPTGTAPLPFQACSNWHFRECRSMQCRYRHSRISCGSNHRAPQCPSGDSTGQLLPSYTGTNRRQPS